MSATMLKLLIALALLSAASANLIETPADPDIDASYGPFTGNEVCIEFCPPPNVYVDGTCNPPVGGCERWDWSEDSNADGHSSWHGVGHESEFEIYGMAVHHDLAYTTFFIASNSPLTGINATNTGNGLSTHINPGALFLDFNIGPFFPRFDFGANNVSENVWGIHFSPDSDDIIQDPGVYADVVYHHVQDLNSGYFTRTAYENDVWADGGVPGYGTKVNGPSAGAEIPAAYFYREDSATGYTPTSIKDGTRKSGFKFMQFSRDEDDPSKTITLLPDAPFNNEMKYPDGSLTKVFKRYDLNNPASLSFTFDQNAPDTPENVCTGAVMTDVTCEAGGVLEGKYKSLRPPSFATAKFEYGIRVPNSAWGPKYADKEAFRACFTFECANDVICLDGRLGCD